MAISIKKITEHIGAEIGCDCRLDQLSESDFEDVVKAFDEHSVLVFERRDLFQTKNKLVFQRGLVRWKPRLTRTRQAVEQ